MLDALVQFLSGSFMPHGHCYLWAPEMVWLQAVANGAIGLAYLGIAGIIYSILKRTGKTSFSWIYLAFGVFIVTGGLTHFMDVVTIWRPVYWLDGGVRAVTAIASIGAAALLLPLVPKAVALARASELAHARGVELEKTHEELAKARAKTKAMEQLLAERSPSPPATEPLSPIEHELERAIRRRSSGALSVPTASGSEPPLVVVADDNEDMRRFTRETLAASYRVEAVADGLSALEAITRLKPDAVVTDAQMPGLSGEELVAKMAEDPELAAIPVLVMSARVDDAFRVRVLRRGARDYALKPFAAEELLARVKNLVVVKLAKQVLQGELNAAKGNVASLAAEVSQKKRELEAALAAMRAAKELAEKASQAKSNFLNLLSHEIRTPLASLQLELELMTRAGGELSERQRKGIDKMRAQIERLSDLMRSLLEYVSLHSGQRKLDEKVVDIGVLAAEVVKELKRRADGKGLELSLRIEPGGVPFKTDPHLVRLALRSLLENAIKYTLRGGIEVVVSISDGEHRVSVKDTGPGIPPEQQALIFEPFEHLEPIGRKHTVGLGLGLALAKKIHELLGGRIELSSQVGSGSTFTSVLYPPSGPSERRVA